MSRAVFRCHGCRYSVLEAFASLSGVPLTIAARHALKVAKPQQRRQYTSSLSSRTPAIESSPAPAEKIHSGTPPPTQVPESIPWYLRIPDPTPPNPVSPLVALQEIPPLPPNPPSILQPILDRLSTEIGLDNLTILDLRNLHPPPALGANLIMVIGTARSVKHLNTGADRFCRWLRGHWKLTPFADGLLGRNELKLRLRRKARREKMMGLVGGREVASADYGITTGWVCVNVGMVDQNLKPRADVAESATSTATEAEAHASDIDEEEYQNPSLESFEQDEEELEVDRGTDDDYIGFGSRTLLPRIVVQMFTEEKRLEMDLEGLWEHRNTKRGRAAEKRILEAEDKLRQKNKGKITMKGLESVDPDGEDTDELNNVWRQPSTVTGKPRKLPKPTPAPDENASIFD
jgi:hypothetical protein